MRRFIPSIALLMVAAQAFAGSYNGPTGLGSVGPQGPIGTASGTGTTGALTRWTNGAGGVLGDSNTAETGVTRDGIKVGTTVFNQLNLTGSATGGSVGINALGGDASVSIKITPLGLGEIILDGPVHPTGGAAGITQILNVRAAGGAGDCTITVTKGIVTASTC